jgi:hypothetical protein
MTFSRCDQSRLSDITSMNARSADGDGGSGSTKIEKCCSPARGYEIDDQLRAAVPFDQYKHEVDPRRHPSFGAFRLLLAAPAVGGSNDQYLWMSLGEVA